MKPVALFALAALLPAQELDFLRGHTDFRNIRSMLPDYLKREAAKRLEARPRIASAAALAERQRYVRERMLAALGGLPERTPLNARTVGVLEREGYRIEKVIFESQPRFYVTANLYLPKRGQPPWPAILYPLGHEAGAKAHGTWQQMLGSLAEKGYVALAWDPVGQGERVQIYDEDTRLSKVVRSTTEHTILGIQCLLVGDNLARYTIWDGMRALDYLLSRKEVDAKRVAVTGNSGGGTHTAYLAALDDRIHVAAPSCYLTSWRRLLETIGPQDAEQCLPPWLADGLDHADFIYAASKPYLMLSAIRDFFSITGARRTFEEARGVYQSLGWEDRIRMVEADDGHGYSKPRRMAAYAWFARWLKGAEDNEPEPEVAIATEKELWCTPNGQVDGETVFTLNQKRIPQRKPAGNLHAQVRRLIGFEKPQGAVPVSAFGAIERPGYRIEKLVYESEPEIVVPSLLFVPQGGGRRPAAIFVDGRGKSGSREAMEALAKAGTVVLAIDARGFGETRTAGDSNGSDWPRYFGDYESAMTALLLGKTLVGMRAVDISRGVDLLAARPDVDPGRIEGHGIEGGAIPLLHAAVLDPRIGKLTLRRMIGSYESVVRRRIHRGVFESVVPGVLRIYDLPELVAAVAPRTVALIEPVDPLGQP